MGKKIEKRCRTRKRGSRVENLLLCREKIDFQKMDGVSDADLGIEPLSERNKRLQIRREKQVLEEISATAPPEEPSLAEADTDPETVADTVADTESARAQWTFDLKEYHERLLDPVTRGEAMVKDPNVQILAKMWCVDIHSAIHMHLEAIGTSGAGPQDAAHHYVSLTIRVGEPALRSMEWYMYRYLVHYMQQQGTRVDHPNQEIEVVMMDCTHVCTPLYEVLYRLVYRLRVDVEEFMWHLRDANRTRKQLCECKEVHEYCDLETAYAECAKCAQCSTARECLAYEQARQEKRALFPITFPSL